MPSDLKGKKQDLTPWFGERSSAIGKRFGRLKTQLGYDGRYVFHSFRKTMATLLERLGLHHNEAAEIIGHEKLGETYGRYSKGLTILRKQELINKIHFGLYAAI